MSKEPLRTTSGTSNSGLGSGSDSEEDEQVPKSTAEGAGYEDVSRSESAFDDPDLVFL